MKVLVIGGGIGGLSACTGIRSYVDSQVEIILVEPKDHIEIFWASYRSLFDMETAESSLFALDLFASKHNVLHIQSFVTELTLHQVKLDNGQVIGFDVCVLATGASIPFEGLGRGLAVASNTRAERLRAMSLAGKALLEAETVVIVGGGLIGSELAGDLAVYSRDRAKSTRVILVHSGDHLVPEMNGKAATMLQDKLSELGVKIILNEKAMKTKNGNLLLESSGDVLEADHIVWTVGIEPVNNFVDPGHLNDNGWIEVDEYFQVKGAEGKLFAIGDCCTALPNAGSQILANINVIGYNVKKVLEAKQAGTEEKPSLSKHYHGPEVYICTVGPEDGVAYTGYCSFDWMIPRFKNYTMFLFEPRNKLGLEQEEKPSE